MIRPPIGHVYGYRLEPLDDGTGTLVTSYYDWSDIHPDWKAANIFPVLSEGALRATLGILARTASRGWPPGLTAAAPVRHARRRVGRPRGPDASHTGPCWRDHIGYIRSQLRARRGADGRHDPRRGARGARRSRAARRCGRRRRADRVGRAAGGAPRRSPCDPHRTGADPRHPRGGDDACLAGVPHHRERRQRAHPERRHRRAGGRPADRDPHPRDRPLGGVDARPGVGRRARWPSSTAPRAGW